jgi:CRP-like cAMP-binding protein
MESEGGMSGLDLFFTRRPGKEPLAENRVHDTDLCRQEFFEAISAGERALSRLFHGASARTFEAGDALLDADRPVHAIFFVRLGWAAEQRHFPDGRRVVPALYLPGDLVGAPEIMRARTASEIIALNTVSAICLDDAGVHRAMGDPAIMTYLAWCMSQAHRRAGVLAAHLARFSARERLAAMLLDLHDRLRRVNMATAASFNLPLTQQQMADHLGLTVVHVNRVLRQLREENIALVDRHVVMLQDIPQLRDLARGKGGVEAV